MEDAGLYTFVTSSACSIGMARRVAVDVAHVELRATHLAFLDDDCFPQQGWARALSAHLEVFPESGLVFGPRMERSDNSIGGLIRQRESSRSSKIGLLRDGVGIVRNPNALCAGGNMMTRVDLARQFGIFDEGFEGHGFEDVDHQILLESRGISTYFVADLIVSHVHPLSIFQLLKKSIASGRGIALMRLKHGARFLQKTKWSRLTSLVRYPALIFSCFIGMGALASVSPLALVVVALLSLLEVSAMKQRSRIVWLTFKSARDLFVLIGFLIEVLSLASGELPKMKFKNKDETRSNI